MRSVQTFLPGTAAGIALGSGRLTMSTFLLLPCSTPVKHFVAEDLPDAAAAAAGVLRSHPDAVECSVGRRKAMSKTEFPSLTRSLEWLRDLASV